MAIRKNSSSDHSARTIQEHSAKTYCLWRTPLIMEHCGCKTSQHGNACDRFNRRRRYRFVARKYGQTPLQTTEPQRQYRIYRFSACSKLLHRMKSTKRILWFMRDFAVDPSCGTTRSKCDHQTRIPYAGWYQPDIVQNVDITNKERCGRMTVTGCGKL